MERRFRIYDGNPPNDDATQALIDRIVKQLNRDMESLYHNLSEPIPWDDTAENETSE